MSNVALSVLFIVIKEVICISHFPLVEGSNSATTGTEINNMKIEKVTDRRTLGESPYWDADLQVLYFIDIKEASVFKYDPATKKETSFKLDGNAVGFAIPIKGENDKFLVALDNSLVKVTWDGESSKPAKVEHLVSVDKDKPGTRLNDGKADPSGTVWAGSMGHEISPGVFASGEGSLYSFKKPQSPVPHVSGIGISNGLTWTRDLKTMYYIDSMNRKVEAFDLDASTPKLNNRRVILDFQEKGIPGNPDGMTIDKEGKLWVACFGGGQIVRIDPDARSVVQTIPIPAFQVTCMAFGGRQLDELYVTTANVRTSPENQKKYPDAGATFLVSGLGVKGYPGDPAVLS